MHVCLLQIRATNTGNVMLADLFTNSLSLGTISSCVNAVGGAAFIFRSTGTAGACTNGCNTFSVNQAIVCSVRFTVTADHVSAVNVNAAVNWTATWNPVIPSLATRSENEIGSGTLSVPGYRSLVG